ncbi:hypothetical protein HDU92_008421, partial [Lobulomyces angularis]
EIETSEIEKNFETKNLKFTQKKLEYCFIEYEKVERNTNNELEEEVENKKINSKILSIYQKLPKNYRCFFITGLPNFDESDCITDINVINRFYDDSKIEEIPEIFLNLLKKFNIDKTFNQLTVNEYLPGQGIPGHCDTHSVFDDEILLISLVSGIIFEIGAKSVYIPPKSLISMQGFSRYGLEHSIKERKVDVVYNKIVERRRRISLTFRTVKFKDCSCAYSHLCDSQKNKII